MKVLEDQKFEIYIVGGAVRDLLLGKSPVDIDLATNATPEQVQKLFPKTVPTGIKHGTITVLSREHPVEVTTFRSDGNYSDNRRPDQVVFVSSIEEDLSRRDFTVNAIAYNFTNNCIIDPYNGVADLESLIIRAVGDPADRFKEDALRVLRAIRFAVCLGFSIERETYKALETHGYLLAKVSKERIRDEFSKILVSQDPVNGLLDLKALNLMQYIVPELILTYDFDQHNKNHSKDIFSHIISTVQATKPELVLRLSALFHDIGKPLTFTVDDTGGHFYGHHLIGEEVTKHRLKALKYDNKIVDTVALLVREHMSRFPNVRGKSVKKLLNRVGVDNISYLIELQRADILGHGNKRLMEDLHKLFELETEIQRVLNEKEPFGIKDLAVNGNDLKEIGIPESSVMGNILRFLLEEVLEHPEKNNKDKLMDLAKTYFCAC